MNIAYLVDSDRWDPAALYTRDLACAMKRQGHNVVVCIPKDDALEHFFNDAGLYTRKIIYTSLPFFNPTFLSGMINKERVSIIHANSLRTASLATRSAQLSGRNDVNTIFTPHSDEKNFPIVADIMSSLDALVLHREESYRPIENMPTQVFSLKYSVPSDSRTTLKSSSPKIITVNGAITPEKKIDRLLEAASHLEGIDYRIRIIGEGKAGHVMPLKQAAQRFDISDRIEWTGNRPDARDLIRDSAVGVDFSGYEGLYRIAEFQSAGVPVIAINDFGTSDYITEGENGFIVHNANIVEELTNALRTALVDTEFRNRFEDYRQKNPIQPYDNYAVRMASIYSSLL